MLLLLPVLWSLVSAAGATADCGLTTGRTLTVIKSGGFPARYAPNADCRYTVRRRSRAVCSVTFLFNVMDLEASPNCTKDYLVLKGERMCGSKPTGFSRTVSFPEGQDSVTMSFHSDNETRGLGYMVTVVQQDCPRPSCDAVFNQSRFALRSPNRPLPYDNGQDCAYRVEKASAAVCRLLMRVTAFDVEEDEQCASDYLLVDGDKMCGKMSQGQILDVSFPNSTLLIEFHSDHVTTRDGFDFDVEQVTCDPSTTTPPATTTTTAEVTSAADTATATTTDHATTVD